MPIEISLLLFFPVLLLFSVFWATLDRDSRTQQSKLAMLVWGVSFSCSIIGIMVCLVVVLYKVLTGSY